MQYPNSPVHDTSLIFRRIDKDNKQIQIQNVAYFEKVTRWLRTAPKVTSFRVNTALFPLNEMRGLLDDYVKGQFQTIPKITFHDNLPDVIILHNLDRNEMHLECRTNEVIVDIDCAAAILRGSHIFAPGVMGMLSGTKKGDEVSIFSDLSGNCRKGLQKIYDCPRKVFIGNGIVKMVRYQLYSENLSPTGIAVQVTDTISGCPQIDIDLFPQGSVLLQNLPSIVCGHVLSLKMDSVVLDMCASPGNKTTHIAALIQNKGVIVAIDKTPRKIEILEKTCNKFGAKVHIFQADSTKIFDNSKMKIEDLNSILNGPPFTEELFDRILLDAPCSALGKRPQLSNNITEKVVNSYIKLQRRLFENAVHLLKVNGYLVYSTCTITVTENEEMVSWALRRFRCLKLKRAVPYLGEPGLRGTDLTDQERACVQRFGPNENFDSVGFFLALFVKTNNYKPFR